MKARDIIPGWPRGKSTSGPSDQGPYNFLMYHLALYSLRAKVYAEQVNAEAEENRCYHAGQQAMVDWYFGRGWFWMRLSLNAALGTFESTNRTACGADLR